MALNASGQLSMGGATVGESINLELNLAATAQIGLDDAAVRTLAGVSTGAIALNNFYGKSNLPTYFVSSATPTVANYPVNWVDTKVVTSGNSYIIGWQQDSGGGGGNATLTKINTSGAEVWTKKLGWPNSVGIGAPNMYYTPGLMNKGLADVNEDSSGNVYFTYHHRGTYRYFILFKFNSSGAVQFAKYFGGDADPYLNVSGIRIDSSGNFYYLGQRNTDSRGIIIKVDNTGTKAWQKYYELANTPNGHGNQSCPDFDSSGNLYFQHSYSVSGTGYVALCKINPSDGSVAGGIRWEMPSLTSQPQPTTGGNPYRSFFIDSSDNIYGNYGSNLTTGVIKWNSSFTMQWMKRLSSSDHARFISPGSNNNIIVSQVNGNNVLTQYNSLFSNGEVNYSRSISTSLNNTTQWCVVPVGDGVSTLSFAGVLVNPSSLSIPYIIQETGYAAPASIKVSLDGSSYGAIAVSGNNSTNSAPFGIHISSGTIPSVVDNTSSSSYSAVALGSTLVVYSLSGYSLSNLSQDLIDSFNATFSATTLTGLESYGSATFTIPGTYSWTSPAGVTKLSAFAVGGGGGANYNNSGGGGGAVYINGANVASGSTHTIKVGAGGQYGYYGVDPGANTRITFAVNGGGSPSAYICAKGGGSQTGGSNIIACWPGGSYISSFGSNGGGAGSSFAGGGGAGGYAACGQSSTGGQGGTLGGSNSTAGAGGAGTNGAGGGGHGTIKAGPSCYYGSRGGGGVGLLGRGTNGRGGSYTIGQSNFFTGGSLGGGYGCFDNGGGRFGGGGGAGGGFFTCCGSSVQRGGSGGGGAVRIIWPGNTRTFPSTNTGSY